MSKFKSLKVVDNFYQNNLFFPMPTVAVTTLCDDGSTTIGSYSLVFRQKGTKTNIVLVPFTFYFFLLHYYLKAGLLVLCTCAIVYGTEPCHARLALHSRMQAYSFRYYGTLCLQIPEVKQQIKTI